MSPDPSAVAVRAGIVSSVSRPLLDGIRTREKPDTVRPAIPDKFSGRIKQ